MKKHIIICLPLVFVLASCIQNDKKVADEIPLKKLDNTTWTFQVAENC